MNTRVCTPQVSYAELALFIIAFGFLFCLLWPIGKLLDIYRLRKPNKQ